MGRRRQPGNAGLPPRMHQRRNKYYYVEWTGEKRIWHPLGSLWSDALRQYAIFEKQRDDPPEDVFRSIAMRYLTKHVSTLEEKTQVEYRREVTRAMAIFGDMKLAEITAPQIAELMDRMSDRKTAANRIRSRISEIFTYAVRLGLAATNPALSVKPFKTSRRDRYITDEEFHRIIEAAGRRFRLILQFAYATGLRSGDLRALRWDMVVDNTLPVSQKKNRAKTLYLESDELTQLLEEARALRVATSPWILCNGKGEQYTADGLKALWRSCFRRAGVVSATFHDIRAKAITDAKERGDAPQDFSAHKSATEAEKYVRERAHVKVKPLNPYKF